MRERVYQGRRAGHRFISIYQVVCELETGMQPTGNREDKRGRWIQLLRHARLWPQDIDTTRVYLELRRTGRVLFQVDMVLAAQARPHRLTVLTTDCDFDALSDPRVENGTVASDPAASHRIWPALAGAGAGTA